LLPWLRVVATTLHDRHIEQSNLTLHRTWLELLHLHEWVLPILKFWKNLC
jgi:hypothetical protein